MREKGRPLQTARRSSITVQVATTRLRPSPARTPRCSRPTGALERNPMIASRRIRPGLLAVCLAGAALVVGCAVTLVSSYDESTDKGVSALQTKADALMTQLDQEHVPAYTAVKPSYDGVRSDLGSLQFRN